mmetsp:Transcript_16294/g.18449  ORF Transcript_16294/g.18449 Transcript_16294/m.18449 type:complete len:82 (-) Transcript_16294:816-1061(-)
MPTKFVGTVVSTAMNKSIVVKVQRQYLHPVFLKHMRKSKKFLAHDEHEACKLGDKVEIMQCRRISKRKHFTLNDILRTSKV